MPAMSLGSTPLWAITSFITPYWLDQISMGLCSTQLMGVDLLKFPLLHADNVLLVVKQDRPAAGSALIQ